MNILIFYASYGTGHANAAKSLSQHISNNYKDATVEMIDCVKYVNKSIEKITTTAYKVTSENIPWVWGKVYKSSKNRTITHLTSRSNSFFAVKLLKLLRKKQPDLIISTHPFASQMCGYLKRKKKITSTLATIFTDFKLHEQWLIGKEYNDIFFVSNTKMKDSLVSDYGVEDSHIHVTGIPISPTFLDNHNKAEILERFSLLPHKKNILFFARCANTLLSNKLTNLFESLITSSNDLQIIVITGKNNDTLASKFKEIAGAHKASYRVRLIDFTDKVSELMYISDLVITKPGGLTVSESLASNLPLLIINPFPGQEEENALFLEESNVGTLFNKHDNVHDLLNMFLFDENSVYNLHENIKLISKPDACQSISKILLDNK